MSCLGTKDILFGGNGADILAALTDKGQNRLYGWWWRYPIRWRQRQAIWRRGDDILFAGRVTTTGGDEDQFWIAAAEVPDSPNTITDSSR